MADTLHSLTMEEEVQGGRPEEQQGEEERLEEFADEDIGPEANALGGATLLEAIDQEVVLPPPLVNWAGWQHWRREFGFRPREPVGFRGAFRRREGLLHRQFMARIHGDDWRAQLEAQEYATAEEDPPDGPAPEARPPVMEPERPAAVAARQDQLAVAAAPQPGPPGQVAPRGVVAGEGGAVGPSLSEAHGSSSGGLSPGS